MECGSCRKVLATINEFIFFVKGDKVSDPTPFLEKFAKTAGNSFEPFVALRVSCSLRIRKIAAIFKTKRAAK